MTDNSSLIPSQSAFTFAQQGQVDWVAVAQTPVAFTLEVLARYGKAGVDGLTVGIARAVCSQFNLKPAAQKRLDESISKLKTIHSFGKIAWFGFGLKHIIDDLLETEQGAACVALSGCLTTCYDTDFASQVFRSICHSKGAPSSLTPSIRQWGALVRICAGSLANSQFPYLLIGFERLLGTQFQDRHRRSPPESETLARAIIILGSLSKRDLRSATFSGGLDCAWIAAMAEWMLCLGVEINDSSGHTLYRSQSLSTSEIANVIINIDARHLGGSSLSTHRTFYLPSGKFLLRPAHIHPGGAVKRPVPWTEILGASFGQEILLSLLIALNDTIGLLIRDLLDGINNPHYYFTKAPLIPSNDSSHSREFAEWAMWRLPELRPCIDHSVGQLLSSPSYHIMTRKLEECWHDIRGACSCSRCSPQPGFNTELCLEILTLTILDYLGMLYTLSIDATILPSCNGLRYLYNLKAQQLGTTQNEDVLARLARPHQITSDLNIKGMFEVLTGQGFDTTYPYHAMSAISANGICMFAETILELDTSPLDINKVKVIPGYIEFEGSPCEAAINLPGWTEDVDHRHPRPQFFPDDTSHNMVVHQKWHDTCIYVGYQLTTREIVYQTRGLCSTRFNVWRKRTLCDCTVWCRAESHKNSHSHYLPGQKTSRNHEWLAVALTSSGIDIDHKISRHTLEAFRCSYPQLYLDILLDRPNSRVCLVRIRNCSKCLLMYAAETLFNAPSVYEDFSEPSWVPKGIVTIRRPGAEEVKVELHEQELRRARRNVYVEPLSTGPYRYPSQVESVPLFPNVPLDHDPID
jgi:hypothetical protein